MKEDLEHLRLLAIFHFVMAGLSAFFACIPVIHLVLGIAIVNGAFPAGQGAQMPKFIGWFFIVIACFLIVVGWAFAVGLFFAGRCLQQRRRHTFCVVMAALVCMNVPLGTVLGVLTLIVLFRPGVKEMFAESGQPPFAVEIADESFRT